MKPFERLDQAMNRRRLELRMNWRELAEAAGISYTALRAIRRGGYRPTELTARGLDEALHWAPGSVHTVLDGGEPSLLGVQAPPKVPEGASSTTPSLKEKLELAGRLMAAQVRELDLSPDEAAEAWQLAQERITRAHEAATQSPPEALTDTIRHHSAG
jgi:transcriptional regulator with XRE-family HTH domain